MDRSIYVGFFFLYESMCFLLIENSICTPYTEYNEFNWVDNQEFDNKNN